MNPRRPLTASLLVLSLTSAALADDPVPSMEAPGAVTFTPGAALTAGVTFTPGPMPVTFVPGPAPIANVTFTPGRDPHDPTPSAPTPPTLAFPTSSLPALVPTAEPPPILPVPVPVPASLPLATPAASAAPTASAAARVIAPIAPIAPPSPEDPGAYGCHLDSPIAHVDLRTSPALRAVQVALATHGTDAIALVTLARAGGPYEGMVFPESRLVRLPAHGSPIVADAAGFEPDATLALGADGNALALGYTHLDPRGGPGDAQSVRLATLGPQGQTVVALHGVRESAGLTIDSVPVAYDQGFAVVLGRPSVNADGTNGAVREWLYLFDTRGEPAREPWLITDAQSDDTMSRFRLGLGVVPADNGGPDRLSVTWTAAQGESAGVWERHLQNGELSPTRRLSTRPAWGALPVSDGTGVMFRTDGDRGTPIELWFQRWDSARPERIGAGWDPALSFVRGRVLVADVTLASAEGAETPALVGVSPPGQPMRAVATAMSDAGNVLERAVDFDMATTNDGVVVAWIESGRGATSTGTGDVMDDPGPRGLAVARVVCGP